MRSSSLIFSTFFLLAQLSLSSASLAGSIESGASYVSLEGSTIQLSGPINVSHALTLSGPGVIQCKGSYAFNIQSESISFQGGISFVDCPFVAMIHQSSLKVSTPLLRQLRFKSCLFLNSSILSITNASQAEVSIVDCQVDPHPSQPAIQAVGTSSLFIDSTTFNASSLSATGISAIDVTSVSITSSLFIGLNSGYGYGAAVAISGSKTSSVTLYNSTLVNNSASMPTIPEDPNSTASSPAFTTSFQLPLGGAFFVDAPSAQVSVYSCIFQGNSVNAGWAYEAPFGGGGGAVAIVSSSSLSINTSLFEANNANGYFVRGGALFISSSFSPSSQSSNPNYYGIEISSCSFDKNFVGLGGGALALLGSSSARVSSSTFSSNTAAWRLGADDWFGYFSWYATSSNDQAANYFGGAILAWPSESSPNPNPNQKFSLQGSKLIDNSAPIHGGGLALRGFSGGVSVSSCDFSLNLAGFLGAGIHMADFDYPNASIALTSSNFTRNKVGYYGVSPSDQAPGLGGALSLDKPDRAGPATLSVTFCNMVENSAGFGGGAMLINNPQSVVIANSTFRGNFATLQGGAFASSSSAKWIINSTIFENNTAGDLRWISNTTTMLQGKSYGGAISFVASTLVWISEGSRFVKNQASLGGAIFGMRLPEFFIGQINPRWLNSDVTFEGNQAVVGGAIYVNEDVKLFLQGYKVLFENNHAVTGGALAIFGSHLQTLWLTFRNNTALVDTAPMTTIQLNWARQLGCGVGNGGAICFSGYPTELTAELLATVLTGNRAVNGGAIYNAATGNCGPSCFRLIAANCTIDDNVAQGGGGGAIYWVHEQAQSNICGANTTLDLLTQIYTSQMYARGMIADQLGSPVPCAEWSGNAAIGGYGNIVASSPFSLRADPYSLFYKSNDNLAINVSVLDYYGQQVNGISDQNQVLVEAVSQFISDQTQVLSSNGTASFTSLKLRTPPGLQLISFTSKTSTRELQATRSITQVRPCLINEYSSPGLGDMCLPCDAGSYNLDPSLTSCTHCPDHALCSEPSLGGGVIVPELGWWNSNPFNSELVECPSGEACVGANRTLIIAQMQEKLLSAASDLLSTFYSELLSDELHAWAANASASAIPALPAATLSALKGGAATRGHSNLLNQILTSSTSSSQMDLSSLDLNSNKTLDLSVAQKATVLIWLLIKDQSRDSSSALNASRRILIISGFNLLNTNRGQVISSTSLTANSSATAVDLPAQYEEGVCSDGYEGNLCASCTLGYGAAGDDVTCNKCSSKTVSAVYYTLTTVLTLAFLAFLLRTSVKRMDFIVELTEASRLIAEATGGGTLQQTLMVLDADGDGVISVDEIRALDKDRDGVVTADEIRARVNAAHRAPEPLGKTRPARLTIDNPADGDPRPSRITGSPRTTFNSSVSSERGSSKILMSGQPASSFLFDGDAKRESIKMPEALEERVKKDGDLSTLLGDSPILKILISYIQVIVMVRLVGLDLGTWLQSFFNLISTITSIPGKYVSIDCSLPYGYVGAVSIPAFKTILAILSPIYLSFLICLLIIIWRPIRIMLTKLFNRGYVAAPRASPLKDYFSIVVLGVTFFLYPGITQAILNIFLCQGIDAQPSNALVGEAGTAQGSYWVFDLDQKCYTGYHLALVIALGAPGLALFALGLPIFNYAFLVYHQRAAHENLHFISVFQFLFEGYKAQLLGWESLVMGRKLLLSITIVFMISYDVGTQLLVMLAILMVALMLQTSLNPYESDEMNNLEKLSLWVTIITLYLSLYLAFSPTMTHASRMTISGLILAVNAVCLAVFAYCICKEYYGTVIQSLGLHQMREGGSIKRTEVKSILERKLGPTASTILSPVLSPMMRAERKLVKSASFVRESFKKRISSGGGGESFQESRSRLLRNAASVRSPGPGRTLVDPPSVRGAVGFSDGSENGGMPLVAVDLGLDPRANSPSQMPPIEEEISFTTSR